MTDKTNVNKDRVRLLVDALRSDEFVQGPNRLKWIRSDGSTQYCCLGVACVVAKRNGLDLAEDVVDDADERYSYFGKDPYSSAMFMPQLVMDWYGFAGDNSIVLDTPSGMPNDKVTAVDLNDTYNFDFAKIAKAFEDTFLREDTVGEK